MAVVGDMATATGATILLVATLEVFMVLYRRVNERLLANARQEGRQEAREEERRRLREWYYSLPQDVRDQLPPPDGLR